MRSARFVCLSAILISMFVLAQSSRDQLADKPNGMSIAQQRHPALTQNPSKMPQGAPFAQRGAGVPKAIAPRRRASPMQGGLNFANAVAYGSGVSYAWSVVVADVNGDGKPDIVVTSANTATVGVLLGNGDGTFQTAVTYGSGGYSSGFLVSSVAVADVNGDGKPDLLVANGCLDSNCDSGGLGVLLGNGDGTFQTAVPYASGGSGADSVAVADVNRDGKPDLLVANECGSGDSSCEFTNGTMGVLLGNGDGTFQTAVPYASGGSGADSVAVADVNGDGKPDLLVANCSADNDPQCDGNGNVGVLLGNGDGTFQTVAIYGSGGVAAQSVAVVDVNGDGKPDLLVANYCAEDGGGCFGAGTVGVLLGNGDGTFQTVVPYRSGGYLAKSVAVGDVNGDGKPDLLVANECASGTEQGGCTNYTGTVGVLLGNGDGTFQTVVTYASGGYRGQSVAVADVNGDGKPDLMLANRCADSSCTTNGTVGVLINTSFTPTKTTLISSQNPSNFGQAVTFTATLTGQQGFDKGAPTGTVSFYDGTTNIGNSNLNSSGVATLTTSTLSVGTHSVTATYNGDTNFLPSTSPVLCQVVQGSIALLSPSSLNFGNQTVDITSSPQNVTLQNTGNIKLTITSIQITGTNSGDFGEKNNCPSSLPPNNSCQISVTFTPTTTGTRNAAVNITDNAPNSPQSVPLTGVGVVPAVTFSPKSLTFATQLVFTTSKAQQVTLTNSGAGILKISHIGVASPFQKTNNCPNSLVPGENCTINIEFHPTTKGVFHGTISVTDNAPGSPHKVPLTGTGTFVQLVPTTLNFGTQPVGTRSLPKGITLTNKGGAAVNITSISITGVDAKDFAETNTCAKSVASGASCFIKVTFKPLVSGKRTADVSVYDNGGGSPQQVGLTGTGT
jgi:hypothetical protein